MSNDPGQMKQAGTSSEWRRSLGLLSGLLLICVWAYWTALAVMVRKWSVDPQYSHGFLVPLFAAGLIWSRSGLIHAEKWRPSLWGLPVLFAGLLLRMVGTFYYYEWFDFLSLIPVLAGAVLLVGGLQALRWSWPAVLFLFFMIPLPYSVEVALQGPLRQIGTACSTYLMQTLGLPALAEGNVIVMGEHKIGVEEACSGLRMLMIFFALSTAVALLSERALWERIVIVLSAVPIALITNIMRITVTGIFYLTGYKNLADLVFHDLAGWLMMPFALGLLWLELGLLSRLFITEEQRPMVAGLQTSK